MFSHLHVCMIAHPGIDLTCVGRADWSLTFQFVLSNTHSRLREKNCPLYSCFCWPRLVSRYVDALEFTRVKTEEWSDGASLLWRVWKSLSLYEPYVKPRFCLCCPWKAWSSFRDVVSVTVFCLGSVGRWLRQDRDESRADRVGLHAPGGSYSYTTSSLYDILGDALEYLCPADGRFIPSSTSSLQRRCRSDTVDVSPFIAQAETHQCCDEQLSKDRCLSSCVSRQTFSVLCS